MTLADDLWTSTDYSIRHECPPVAHLGYRLCPFTLSHDPDYLADLTDRRLDPTFHRKLCIHFFYPVYENEGFGKEAATYATKFDRYQRLNGKWTEKTAEVRRNTTRFLGGVVFPLMKRELPQGPELSETERMVLGRKSHNY